MGDKRSAARSKPNQGGCLVVAALVLMACLYANNPAVQDADDGIALRLARSPMARNESSPAVSSDACPTFGDPTDFPSSDPAQPARRYPSAASAIESTFSPVQSAGTNSPPVSLSKAQHPTESPLCTQLGAPNAAASTTVMPAFTKKHVRTIAHTYGMVLVQRLK